MSKGWQPDDYLEFMVSELLVAMKVLAETYWDKWKRYTMICTYTQFVWY